MWVWRVLQVGVSGLGFWAFRTVEGCDDSSALPEIMLLLKRNGAASSLSVIPTR